MNYRHAFHAGNHADVLKHVLLLGLVEALQRKPSPISVLDTHAGRGLYALDAEEATRTGEAERGIARLEPGSPRERARDEGPARAQRSGEAGPSTPASLPGREGSRLVAAYLDAVAACQAQYGAQAYPGSPWLVANALRADDRLACCELQPEEASALKALFRGDARIAVHARDGYEATRALLPPTPRRGLVLVDPPYEAQLAEFDAILDALRSGSGRWPEGVYLVWYPVKQRRSVQPFLRAAAQLPVRSAFPAELLVRPDDSPLRMNGSGTLVLNAPWQFDATAEQALHALLPALDEGGGTTALRWLRRPS